MQTRKRIHGAGGRVDALALAGAEPVAATGPRIVVADSIPGVRRMHALALAPLRPQITEAQDGWELLWALAEQSQDLVLTRGDLPSVSGIQVLAMARTAGLHTRFVVIAPIVSDRVRHLIVRAGNASIVGELFDSRVLIAACRSALDLPGRDQNPCQRRTHES